VRFPQPFFALFGLGEFTSSFFAGIYLISATFAAYVMRKPGIALVTGLMSALVQVPMGNPWGITLFLYGLMQGAGAEIGYLIFRYKKYGWAAILASATVCFLFSFSLDWFVRALWEYRVGYIVTRFSIRFASAIFFAAVLSKLLADRLAKAGVLKSYPIGEKYPGNIDEP
ncbi:MAG: ECF transporter S component, partial [Treponema sp.]|nr:ECF transporter S component [Treponema sp.]